MMNLTDVNFVRLRLSIAAAHLRRRSLATFAFVLGLLRNPRILSIELVFTVVFLTGTPRKGQAENYGTVGEDN